MAKIAVVEKYPSNINYDTYFDFKYDKYALTNSNIKRITKKDICIDIDVDAYDFVVLVGAEPTKHFCKRAAVTTHQGYLVDNKFLPIVNPLLVKLKPENKNAFEKACEALHNYINGTVKEPVKLTLHGIQDTEEAKAFVRKAIAAKPKIVTLDSETTAFYPRDGYVLGICLAYTEDEGAYIASDAIDEELENLLNKLFSQTEVVFHNYKFDKSFLYYHFGFKFKTFHDTMLMHYILDESEGTHDLKSLSIKYTDLGDYDRELEEFKRSYCKTHKIKLADFTYDLIPFEIIYPYAATDAIATFRLYHKFYPIISKAASLSKVYNNIMLPGIEFLWEMQENGVPISREFLEQAKIDLTEEIDNFTKDLYKVPEVKAYEQKYETIFNVNSPAKVYQLLYEFLKLPKIDKKTSTGNYSMDKEVLEELSKLHKVPKLILELKQLKKILSTYIIKIQAGLDADSRIRTGFNLHTTSSGRLSSSGKINMQQLPRDKKVVKKCIRARKGYKIVAADLQTAEMYIAAALSKDKALAKIFSTGGDFHSECAIMAFGLKPPDSLSVKERRAWVEEHYPHMRQASKAISFGILYGSGPPKVAETAGITLEEAKEVIDTYFRKFPKLKAWLEDQKTFIKQNGYIYSAFGRKRRLKNVFSADKEVSGHEVRSGVNFLVQSVASDINLLGAIRTNEDIKGAGIDAKIFALVHDAILAEVKEEDVETYKNMLLSNLKRDYGASISGVPIGVDIGVADDYASA